LFNLLKFINNGKYFSDVYIKITISKILFFCKKSKGLYNYLKGCLIFFRQPFNRKIEIIIILISVG